MQLRSQRFSNRAATDRLAPVTPDYRDRQFSRKFDGSLSADRTHLRHRLADTPGRAQTDQSPARPASAVPSVAASGTYRRALWLMSYSPETSYTRTRLRTMATTSPTHDKDHDLRDEYSFNHPWPWQVAENMRDLADDGLTPPEMASAMGCHPNTVYRYLDRHGIGLEEVGA